MLDLQYSVKIDDILKHKDNVCDILDLEDIKHIGNWISDQYDDDDRSREEWKTRTAESMKLALQVLDEKTYPWPNAANVKVPILTIGSLGYHSRAYPALLPSEEFVHCRILGESTPEKIARGQRVARHMSFQLSELDTSWEEHTDKALIVQSIIGCAFKKTYYDEFLKTPRSQLVFPQDLVVDYYTTSLEDSPRITHVYPMSRNDIVTRQRRKLFRELTEEEQTSIEMPSIAEDGPIEAARDQAQGLHNADSESDDVPAMILEQHCWIDLDGDDYAEPYIAFVRQDNHALYRLVPRFLKESIHYAEDDEKMIERIEADHYFTKIPFVPSADGGFYDKGFGDLLGATNEAVNTVFNMLLDAGTMSNTGGGFLARSVRVMGGDYSFRPNEWKRTDSTPEQMKNGIVPLLVREPSMVLFKLLELLMQFGEKIGMATDPMTGVSPGQNTPAETTRTTIQQGEKIFNGIYKRTWRSLKEEFRKVYKLNNRFPPKSGKWEFAGGEAKHEDYYESDKSIVPVADRNIASDNERKEQAMTLRQLSATHMGGYDKEQVELRVLSALKIPAIEQVFPGYKKFPPPKPPKLMIEELKAQVDMAKIEADTRATLMELMETRRLNNGKLMLLVAQAEDIKAKGQSIEVDRLATMVNAEIGMAKQQDAHLQMQIDAAFKSFEMQQAQKQQQEQQAAAQKQAAAQQGGAGQQAG